MRRAAPLVVAAVIGAGVTGGVALETRGGGGPSSSAAASSGVSSQSVALTSTPLTAAEIYKRASPGVVDITVTSTSTGGPFGSTQQSGGEGSGFVLDTKGDIVTNEHVVSGATSITVTFSDGTKTKGTLVGSDTSSDLAVIRVSVAASQLKPLTLGTSKSVEPGESVVAIGSPFGYARSITAGIVSAVGREIDAPDGTPIANAVQTDAAINPGNSGGPLIDSSGAVIGVDAQIKSSTDGSEGVGFAIPIDTVKAVTAKLVAGQSVTHAYLGVSVADAANAQGASLASVASGSPAASAGLRQGDVVTAVGDTAVTSASELAAAIASHAVGDRLTLTLLRSGASTQVSVTLTARSA